MLAYLILAASFFVLVPGILVTLPRGGSKYMVALVHTVLFVALFVGIQYISGDLDQHPVEGFAYFMNSSNYRLNKRR
jgi:hypothetical protein